MESIMGVLGAKPKDRTPRYGANDIEFHEQQAMSHLNKACDELVKLGSQEPWVLLVKPGFLEVNEALAKARFTSAEVIRSWVEREFLPKIRRFWKPGVHAMWNTCSTISVPEYGHSPLENGKAHLEAFLHHAWKVSEMLRYLLCDDCSPVAWSASLEDASGVRDVSDWYVGGLRSVNDSISRIDERLHRYIRFAEKYDN